MTATSNNRSTQTTALDVRELKKSYLIPVIDTLTFSVSDGEFVCLLGPNGCGKTTLLRIIAGIEVPDQGEIYLHGTPLLFGQKAQHRIGYVFQEPRLLPWKSVLSNILLAIKQTQKVDNVEAKTRALKYLKLVGLTGFEEYFPNRLSGGMQQRAAIARALAIQPELLLMDESFSALDPENRRILQDELLRIWRETGVTILFVTHNVDEALRLATRLLVLSARPTRILMDLKMDSIQDRHDQIKERVLQMFSEQVAIQQAQSLAQA